PSTFAGGGLATCRTGRKGVGLGMEWTGERRAPDPLRRLARPYHAACVAVFHMHGHGLPECGAGGMGGRNARFHLLRVVPGWRAAAQSFRGGSDVRAF